MKKGQMTKMEEGRRKIHICLVCILLAALAAGVCYYYNNRDSEYRDMEGTLIWTTWEGQYGC